MSIPATVFLALVLSLDAFVAALGRGASLPAPSLGQALRIGAVFAGVEAVTPLLGWGLGLLAAAHVAAVDHWVAFALLTGAGLHMALMPGGATGSPGIWRTAVVALGTSIDAMAVGVSLALIGADILWVVLATGCATLVMSASGILAGRFVGQRLGRRAELLGGGMLILLGAHILLRHLGLI